MEAHTMNWKLGGALLASCLIAFAALIWGLDEKERWDRERRFQQAKLCGLESDARTDKWLVTMLPWEVGKGGVVLLGGPEWKAMMEAGMKLRNTCFSQIP